MASEKLRRENVTDERKIEVEKDRVPKMATHFESLAEKAKGQPHEIPTHVERVHQYETVPVGGTEYSGPAESEMKKREEGTKKGETERRDVGEEIGRERKTEDEAVKQGIHGGERKQAHSLEEISDLRATAQQNSIEAIRAAEERYQKAKESAAAQPKDSLIAGIQTGGGEEKKETFMEKSQQAKDQAMGKGQQAMDYTSQKAKEAKDVISSKGQTAAEKAMAAKDTAVDTTMTAAGYVGEKAAVAKDVAADKTKTAAGYVGEKAAAAKDMTVESGKGAAGYAGKVVSGVKDQAAVAGWGAAHYTLEKVAEATKAVAGVTSSVAGYTGEKAVVAKDKVAEAGQTVAGYAGEKIAAVKDTVVATEEKAAEYAARKREEAKRDLEAKKSSKEEGPGTGTFVVTEQREPKEQVEQPIERTKEAFQGRGGGGVEKAKEGFQGGGGGSEGQHVQKQGGTVLHAIGETLVEIGQTTKDLLIGQYPSQVMEQKDEGKDVKGYKDTGEGI